MDPYIIFKLAHKTYKTNAVQEGGQNPVWNKEKDTRIFEIEDILDSEKILITVMDEDGETSEDSPIAKGEIGLSDVLEGGEFEVELIWKKDVIGAVWLDVEFVSL